jgi:hypothetical protein
MLRGMPGHGDDPNAACCTRLFTSLTRSEGLKPLHCVVNSSYHPASEVRRGRTIVAGYHPTPLEGGAGHVTVSRVSSSCAPGCRGIALPAIRPAASRLASSTLATSV